jgi:hypothetical protein
MPFDFLLQALRVTSPSSNHHSFEGKYAVHEGAIRPPSPRKFEVPVNAVKQNTLDAEEN